MQEASLIFSKRVGEDARIPYIIVRDSKNLEYDSVDACRSVSGNDLEVMKKIEELRKEIEELKKQDENNDKIEDLNRQMKELQKSDLYNVHLLRHFVETVWKIERPQVIISVTGGAQAFDLSSKSKDIIMKGMMDGTRNFKALFITGGTNAGIMRYVGEARAKYNPTAPLVGIAPLAPLKGGPRLLAQWEEGKRKTGQLYDHVKENDRNEREDKNKEIEKAWPKVTSELDNHHSNFILVYDEGSKNFGDENALRAAFEECMSAPKHDMSTRDAGLLDATLDGDDVPIVSVCVQGGPGSITTVAGSVEISRSSYFSMSEYANGVHPFPICN